MKKRMLRYRSLSVAFYVGVFLPLSVYSMNIAAATVSTTELTAAVERSYDAFPIDPYAFDDGLDQDDYVNVGGRGDVLFEINRHDVQSNDVPVPTIALLFPLAMLLFLSRSRWLTEKTCNFMAFPVF
jgi:hypothetical protein